MLIGQKNKRRKCKHCGAPHDVNASIRVGLSYVCSESCRAQLLLANYAMIDKAVAKAKQDAARKARQEKQAAAKIEREKKAANAAAFKVAKLKVSRRSELYDKLQQLVNQFVVHVRDADQGCCTCDAPMNSVWNAGHFIPVGRGGASPLRFDLRNIHKQCVTCNKYNGGRPDVYAEFIRDNYGQDELDRLRRKDHAGLKEQYPSKDDILAAIDEWRGKIRAHGLRPRV